MTRVCILGLEFLPIPSPRGGAIEKWIVEVSRELAKRCSVSVLSLGAPGLPLFEVVDGVSFYREQRPKCPFQNTLRLYLRLLKHLREIKPDLVHVHHRPSVVPLIKAIGNYPCLVHAHNFSGFLIGGIPLEAGAMKAGFAFSRRVVAVSTFLADRIHQKYALPYKRINVVPNGVDTSRYVSDSNKRRVFRTKLGLEDSDKVVLFAGRVIPEKGVHVLVEAFRLVRRKYPSARLVVVGPPGNFHDTSPSKYASELLHKSRDLALFTGAVTEEDLVAAYCAADIFAYPSLWEDPSSIAILEAMSRGSPIVASNIGGIPELLTNGREGLLTEPGNPEDLAGAILKLLEDPQMSERMSEAARARVLSEFKWQYVADHMLGIYRSLLGEE